MRHVVRRFVGVVVGVAGLSVALNAGAAEGGESGGGWTEAMPPQTQMVLKVEPGAFDRFAEGLSARLSRGYLQRVFRADSRMSALVAAAMGVDFYDFIAGESEFISSVDLEHLDRERPVVFALSVDGHEHLLSQIQKGLPPTDASKLVAGLLGRLVVPATDAEALRGELEAMCAETADLECAEPRGMTTRGEWVWIDMTPQREAPAGDEGHRFRAERDFFARRTPAVEALTEGEAGAAFYARADSVPRISATEGSADLQRRVGEIEKASGADRVFDIRRARREVARALLTNEVRAPEVREIEDMAVLARGDDSENVLFELVQTYTRYGAALAEAGQVDTALPTYGLARPVVSGQWRYDVETAFGRASAPAWASDPVYQGSGSGGVGKLFGKTDVPTAVVVALNHPISGAYGVIEAAGSSGPARMLKPNALGALMAGSFSLDVDPVRFAEGRPGVVGGAAVAARPRALQTIDRLIRIGSRAAGLSVTTEIEQREEDSLYKMRLDHDGAFTAGGESSTRRLALQMNLDRLVAKVEMLGKKANHWMRIVTRFARLLQGVELTVDAEDRYRYTRMRMGSYRGRELTVSGPTVELTEPEVPRCFRKARRASTRTYVRAVDEGPYYSSKRGTGPQDTIVKRKGAGGDDESEEESEPPSAELGAEARKAIDELIGKLGERDAECRQSGEATRAEQIGEMRAYWQGVLDGEVATYPE